MRRKRPAHYHAEPLEMRLLLSAADVASPAIAIIRPPPAPTPVAGESFVNPGNGHTYELLSRGTWSNEESEAQSLGGQLATVRSAAENAWLASTFSGFTYWIGLNDPTGDGDFAWASGNTSVYSNWSPSPPAETAGTANAAEMSGGAGTWTGEIETDNLPDAVVEFGQAIPANGTLNSTQSISGLNGTITNVTVNLNITSANDSNLTATLISPGGVSVRLFANLPGSGQNFTQTTLDDSAPVPISAVAAPFTGTFKPQTPLSALSGENPNGTWRLQIVNNGAISTDVLTDWAMNAVTVPIVAGEQVIPNGEQTPQTINGSNFGSTNSSVTQQFAVVNTGSAYFIAGSNVSIGTYAAGSASTSVTITGSDASDFAVLQQPTLPLATGQTSTFVISFTPKAAAVRSAEVSVAGAGGAYALGVEGTGVAQPKISLINNIGGTIVLKEIGKGPFTETCPFTITNTGLGTLTFSDPIFSGFEYNPLNTSTVEADDSSILPITTEPSTRSLSPGQQAAFIATFAPDDGLGSYYASLSVSSNDPAQPTITIPCDFFFIDLDHEKGTAPKQATELGPQAPTTVAFSLENGGTPLANLDTLSLGGVVAGSNSTVTTLTLTSQDTDALDFTTSASGDFSVATTPASSTVLAPGGTLGLVVSLTQSSLGSLSGQITLDVTDPSASATNGFTVAGDLTLQVAAQALAAAPAAAEASSITFIQQATSATAGMPLNPEVEIKFIDQYGNLDTSFNSNVTLSIASGPAGGVLGGTATIAAVSGMASFPGLVLDTAGTYTLAALDTAEGVGPFNSAPITVSPAAAAELVFPAAPQNGAVDNPLLPFTVDAEDAFGNLVPGFDSNVSLSVSSGATLSGTTTVAAAGGAATFNNVSVNQRGNFNLTAASGTLSNQPSGTFTVGPAPSQMAVVTQPASITAGSQFSIVVDLENARGGVLTNDNQDVTLAIQKGAGGALNGTLQVPAVRGVATFSGLSLDIAGSYKLAATAAGLAAKTGMFTVNPAAPADLAFVQGPTTVTAGDRFFPHISVSLTDQFGNPIAGKLITLSVAGGSATILGTNTQTTAANGTATFANINITQAGTYQLNATRGALAAVESGMFTVQPAAPTQLVFATEPTPATVGDAISPAIAVNVEDQFGNIATGNNSTVALSIKPSTNTDSAILEGTFSLAAAGGVATFSDLVLSAPGQFKLIATDGLLTVTSLKFNVIS